MIPKIIHYVWLSGSDKDETTARCIASWKEVLPDYEIREWGSTDIPTEQMPDWFREALQARKYAFATDYLRLWIVYNFGGIYMDGDVLVRKSFDDFLDNEYFTAIEYHPKGFAPYKDRIDADGNALTKEHVPGFALQAAVFGACKGHPFLKDCMSWYEGRHFVLEDGSYNIQMLACDVYALTARDYGFRYIDREQRLLQGIRVYDSKTVAGTPDYESADNYCIHCCNGSWRNASAISKFKRKFLNTFIKPCRKLWRSLWD